MTDGTRYCHLLEQTEGYQGDGGSMRRLRWRDGKIVLEREKYISKDLVGRIPDRKLQGGIE
jgi:hypothetical protein